MFKGLKLRIVTTFLVLFSLAVLLTNIVVVTFWQNAMIRSAKAQASLVLESIVEAAGDTGRRGSRGESEFVQTVISRCSSSELCGAIGFFDDQALTGEMPDKLLLPMRRCAQSAVQAGENRSFLQGQVWSIFSFARKYLFIASPMADPDNEDQAVVMAVDLRPVFEDIKQSQKIIFVYLLVNVLVLTVLGLFRMIKLIIKPVENMIRSTENYLSADSLLFSTENDQSEFAQLKIALNSMFTRISSDRDKLEKTVESLEQANQDLIRAQNDMVRAEKLASVGRLSAGLAHEIGNPIGIIQGYMELLKHPETNESDRNQFASRALKELERINRLIRQLLDFAGSRSEKREEVIIDEQLFEGVFDIIAMEKGSSSISFSTNIEPDLSVWGDKEGLRQVILNGILNAVDAIRLSGRSDGLVHVSAAKLQAAPGDSRGLIELRIRDNGAGIEPDDHDKLYDPFFTTKETGKGTGLGLFVSHSIVEAHGGTLRMENNDDAGVTLFVTLPSGEPVNQDG
jgi:signal transduction histidine kinase